MDVLVEVHDAEEMERALKLSSRWLASTTATSGHSKSTLTVCEGLAPMVPEDRPAGRRKRHLHECDCKRLQAVGINTFLVGESLMRQEDIAAATRALLFGEAVLAAE